MHQLPRHIARLRHVAFAASVLVASACGPGAAPPRTPPPPPSQPAETAAPSGEAAAGTYRITLAGQGMGGESNQTAGDYSGDGRIICTHHGEGIWSVSAVFFADDPVDPATDVLGFDITMTPGSRSIAVTLVEQNVEGPGWFVNERLRPEARFSFDVSDLGEQVTISAVGDEGTQHIEITVTCSMILRSE